MQRRIVGLVLLAAFLAGMAACGRVAPVEESPVDVAALDAFFSDARSRHGIPGLAVVIVDRRGPVYVRGFGVDGEGNPVTPRTPFRIASLSKSFTALAVLQLAEQGQINLDAPVQRYLPEFTTANPTTAAQISVRHLLNQVSGLNDAGYPNAPEEGDLAARVADLHRARPFARPGERYAYFNPNYDTLGRLVEVVSGQTYADYLAANVLTPLAMHSTWAAGDDARPIPRGFLMPFRVGLPTPERLEAPAPSGGLVSTADDMGRFLMLNLNGGELSGMRLLSADGMAQLHTPRQGAEGYAGGWYVRDGSASVRVVEHGGSLATYAATMALLPEQGLGFALLYNENHLLSAFWLQPALRAALVATLGGADLPEQLPPARWIGVGAAVVVIASLLGQVFALLRLPAWRRKAVRFTPQRLAWERLSPLLSLLWLALLPFVLSLVLGRNVTWPVMVSFAPELVMWLVAGIALDVLKSLTRFWPLRGPLRAT